MKKYFFIVASITISLFTSCSKEGSTKGTVELLTQSGWQLQTKEQKIGSATTWADITSTISACKKDDITNFSGPNAYVVTEGGSKCNATDPNTVKTGTWELLNSNSKLKITVSATSIIYDLYSATENSLIIDEVDASGVVVITNRYTFSH